MADVLVGDRSQLRGDHPSSRRGEGAHVSRGDVLGARRHTVRRSLIGCVALIFGLCACGANKGSDRPRHSPHRFVQIAQTPATTGGAVSAVRSVELAHAAPSVATDCQLTADAVGYPIPCPALLPMGMTATPTVHSCALAVVAPVGWAGCPTTDAPGWVFGSSQVEIGPGIGDAPLQHLVLQAAPRIVQSPSRAIDGPAVYPGKVIPRGRVTTDGETMSWYFVPMDNPSAFRGHLILMWSEFGHTYVYGFHVSGTLALARALDLELVRHLTIVKPRPGAA
jgi:hypothetical protein